MIDHKDCWYKNVCSRVDTDLCTDVCIQFYEMIHLLKYSGIPESLYKPIELYPEACDINAFKRLAEIKTNIKDEIQKGLNLYIYSRNCGNAKTSWAIKLLQSYFHSVSYGNGIRPRGFFIHTPSFLIDRKMTFKDSDESNKLVSVKDDLGNELITMNNLLNIDVIVWDEIGVKGMSQFDYLNWLSILDQRILRGKSNIFTGNVNQEDLEAILGHKLISRVWSSSEIIEFKGRDRRGGNA